MRVKNHSNRPVPIGRSVLPNQADAEVEDIYLYQPRIIRLRDMGVLEYPYDPDKPQVQEAAPVAEALEDEEKRVDRLTDLIHIGSGREKKLLALGIITFEEISGMPAEDLAALLDVTLEQADEIIMAAGEKAE